MIFGRFGRARPAPDQGRVKGENNYVGRIVATIFSFGIYGLWWLYDQMVESEPQLPGRTGHKRTPWWPPCRRCAERDGPGRRARGEFPYCRCVRADIWSVDSVETLLTEAAPTVLGRHLSWLVDQSHTVPQVSPRRTLLEDQAAILIVGT